MPCFVATLGLVLLWRLVNLSVAKDTCDIYEAVGQSLTLPFAFVGLTNTHVLRWTHNKTIIFYRQNGRVSVGKKEDISAAGALQLKNIQFSHAGDYRADLRHLNGTLDLTWSGRLCVMDKVLKPELTYVCDIKSNAVKLNCFVAKPQGLTFSWTLDEKTLTSETRQMLSISLAQLTGQRNFSCGVANRVSKVRSDTVRPVCNKPLTSPDSSLLCFKRTAVVAVLAGGLGLILLLLILVITVCCCFRYKKMSPQSKEGHRVKMLSLSKRVSVSTSVDYETMNPTETSLPPSPSPLPKTCYQNVCPPESSIGNKPLEVSTGAVNKDPSPVPKPRTRKIEMSLEHSVGQ